MRLSQVRLKFYILIRDQRIATCGDNDVGDDVMLVT